MLDILGAEKTKLFIKIWGGTTLKVSMMKDLQNCDSDYEIYCYMFQNIQKGVPLQRAAAECAHKFKRRADYCINTYRNLQKFSEQISLRKEQIKKILNFF